jgi:hypothetical protein
MLGGHSHPLVLLLKGTDDSEYGTVRGETTIAESLQWQVVVLNSIEGQPRRTCGELGLSFLSLSILLLPHRRFNACP